MLDKQPLVLTSASVRWALWGCLAVAAMAAACGDDGPTATPSPADTPTGVTGDTAFSLNSDAFAADGAIPARFTCDGEDVSPALAWSDAPAATAAFALIVDDPDAPGGVFTHWVLYNLPADASSLPERVAGTDESVAGGAQGENDFGAIGYRGPCPPTGPAHRYNFTLYALDATLDLTPGASKQQVLDAMEGQILGEARLMGTYQR